MRHDRRGSWYLLTGIVLGLAMGLIYSWEVSPVEYVDAPPYALRADYKDGYRVLVAEAYLYSSDILRAVDRLKQLRDHNISQSLAMQAQQALAENRPEDEIKALSLLALALGKGLTPEASIIDPTISVNQFSQPNTILVTPPLSTPPEDNTGPNATPAPTPTLGAPFELEETRLVCNPDQSEPLIQVVIQDAAGQPVPSIELVVTWDGGEDHILTGLKPELGQGYADFSMTPDVVYTLRLADGVQATSDITAAQCNAEDGSKYWGSWLYTFRQP